MSDLFSPWRGLVSLFFFFFNAETQFCVCVGLKEAVVHKIQFSHVSMMAMPLCLEGFCRKTVDFEFLLGNNSVIFLR